MMSPSEALVAFPRALSSYPDPSGQSIVETLRQRVEIEPFNAVATAIFAARDPAHVRGGAVHRPLAPHPAPARRTRARRGPAVRRPSVAAELLHFFGEIEVVFGLWALVLLVAMVGYAGWEPSKHYFNDRVNYTEPLFVVVIMALASTRPIIALRRSRPATSSRTSGRGTPAAWWVTILIIGPLLGSFITEPAAMTICALLLARQFYDLQPSTRLKYATLGLLFVNVSIGGTLTHFAAPPVLMVARTWDWDYALHARPLRLAGGARDPRLRRWRYFLLFRRELRRARPAAGAA